jgi:ribonuclease R
MRKQQRTSNKTTVTGRVKRNADGFGFLIPEDKDFPDVYLPRHTMDGVMTDDIVTAECEKERDDRYSGKVLEIVKRATTQVVGKFKRDGFYGGGIIVDESKAWGHNINIPPQSIGKAKEGELVAVRILSFPESSEGFTGEVIEVLGTYGDPLLDSKQVLYEHHVPIEFPKAALDIANRLPELVEEKDFAGRKDLREKKFVTIDGATARDFDDAVYAEKEPNGGFRVWVAIADVSYYVREGNALDLAAYERGTSVYFPDMVVPMLPEKISNGLCSLNPHLPRLALVAEMVLDTHGNVTESSFYEAVFMSHHRLIYGEVEDMINGFENPKYKDVIPGLNLMADIARILMKKRFHEGSLDLEIPEAQLLIDATGVPTDVVRGDRLFAHRLIEELMLLANVSVARFISRSGRACLYRIHEEPFADSLKALEIMAHNWGLKLRLSSESKSRGAIQKSLMKMLEFVKGKPEENILSILILRSMKQAQYSPQSDIGHFGLAFDDYTHFTSPIRRYPDLVVHRVLKKIILKQRSSEKNSEDEAEHMATMGTFLSACEQRANKSERDLIAIKRCRFMVRHIGETLDGMITGIAKFGMFVQLRAYDIDGLVRLDTLRGDRFFFDEEKQKLIGRRTGTIISLGDMVQVKVLRADPEARQIDFEWVDQKHAPLDDGKTNRNDAEVGGTPSSDRGRVRQARVPQRAGAGKTGPVHSKKDRKKRRGRKSNRR